MMTYTEDDIRDAFAETLTMEPFDSIVNENPELVIVAGLYTAMAINVMREHKEEEYNA